MLGSTRLGMNSQRKIVLGQITIHVRTTMLANKFILSVMLTGMLGMHYCFERRHGKPDCVMHLQCSCVGVNAYVWMSIGFLFNPIFSCIYLTWTVLMLTCKISLEQWSQLDHSLVMLVIKQAYNYTIYLTYSVKIIWHYT